MDMSLVIALGKVLFKIKVLKGCETRVARKLLTAMLSKNVPGYCSHVQSICQDIFGTTLEELMSDSGDVKGRLKKAACKMQEERLVQKMLRSSKTNAILLHSFQFDGKKKAYLNFPFQEAKGDNMKVLRCSGVLSQSYNIPNKYEIYPIFPIFPLYI